MSYTARLENWLMDNKSGCLIGDIYDDKEKRWQDGTRIKTSKLKETSIICEKKECAVIFTKNSSYLLGKKKENNKC